MKISRDDVRRLFLHSQGLNRVAPFGLGAEGAARAIQQIGYVQIDTISVGPRAHHHILFSRVPDYKPNILHDLQVDSKIFEYWSHAAAYLPIEDFRYALPRMKRIQKTRHWFEKDKKVMRQVLARIKKEGPLQSKDFEKPPGTKSGPWFEWKPHKKGLECLFHEGRLVIRERRGFQKVYDLPERVLPKDIDLTVPSSREHIRHLIESSLDANGFTSVKQAGHLRRVDSELKKEITAMVKRGELEEFTLEGVKTPFFTSAKYTQRLDEATLDESRVKLLSPFDNVLIQRAPLKAIFDFDFMVEFYLPEAKRKYGYFSLPILLGDRFIGRVDTKADRATKRLLLRNVCFENPSAIGAADLTALAKGVHEFREFSGCDEVVVEKVTPSKLKTAVKAAIKT
ncbi:MAG: crosslink repair DNA glycosylase YcaQ family protein [Bdellovibrionota bacterium]